MSNVQPLSSPKRAYVPPPVDGDFYQIKDLLAKEERAILVRVRAFMEAEVAPIINEYWSKAKFPFELVPKLRELGIGGISYEGFGCAGGTNLLNGLICMEIAGDAVRKRRGVHHATSVKNVPPPVIPSELTRYLPGRGAR
jgi:glutaryl-CoA dehydrogenase